MKTFDEVLGELDDGQRAAIIRKVGRARTGDESQVEEVLHAVLSGKLRVELVDGEMKLFDHTGRGIPFVGMLGKVVDANRDFHLTPITEIGCGAWMSRLLQHCKSGTQLLSPTEVETRCAAVLARVAADSQIGNLVNGPHFKFVMPQMYGDLGTLLDDQIVPVLERAYLAQFPGRTFKNWRHGELADQVTVVPGTKHEQFIERLAQGSVCGVYFPCLQGFGGEAARAFIGHLPQYAQLAGMEVPWIAAIYPEVFGRDFHTPGLDMWALDWRGSSLYYEANDDRFGFDRRDLRAFDYCAGGVVALG